LRESPCGTSGYLSVVSAGVIGYNAVMSPSRKLVNAVAFLATAVSIIAIGVAEIHRRHGHGVETSSKSREILAELTPGVAAADRASLRWQTSVAELHSRSESAEADRLRSEMEREDRSAWSKFIARVTPW